MSSEIALPKIRVINTHNLAGSATGTNGTSGLESPSNTTDGGTSARPRSATSSEGMFSSVHYMTFLFSRGYASFTKYVQMLLLCLSNRCCAYADLYRCYFRQCTAKWQKVTNQIDTKYYIKQRGERRQTVCIGRAASNCYRSALTCMSRILEPLNNGVGDNVPRKSGRGTC